MSPVVIRLLIPQSKASKTKSTTWLHSKVNRLHSSQYRAFLDEIEEKISLAIQRLPSQPAGESSGGC